MKRKIIVGVWKDKLSLSDSVKQACLLDAAYKTKTPNFDLCVAPSPAAIWKVKEAVSGNALKIVGQDIHWPDAKRSFTGSTSISMLKEINVDMCMVGHSERRRVFSESNEDIYKKLIALTQANIYPVLAIGDDVIDLPTRTSILKQQIKEALCPDGLPAVDVSKIAIAYEPVWAISTWRTNSPLPNGKEVTDVMSLVADILTDCCRLDIAQTPLLYGGSVSPSNAEEYFSIPLVDGALVGGASLKVESLSALFDIGQKIWFK